MLVFCLPNEAALAFMRGEPALVRINGVPRQLTFDAAAQTVRFTDDEGPQARKLLGCGEENALVRFHCTGADGTGMVIAPNGTFAADSPAQ